MSNNSKINEISNNIFNQKNNNILASKTSKQIIDQKKEFEDELEKVIQELNDTEGKKILGILAIKSEKGNLYIFDNNGNVSISKFKAVVSKEINEMQKNEIKEEIISQQTKIEENIQISKETEKEVAELFSIYANLTSDDEKFEFIKENFGVDKDKEYELAENIKTQMDLEKFVKEKMAKGLSIVQVQSEIDSNKAFDKLTTEQKKVDEDGKIAFEKQLHLEKEIRRTENKIERLKKEGKSNNFSSKDKKELIELKKILEKLNLQHKELVIKTSISQIDRKSLENSEQKKETEKKVKEAEQKFDILEKENTKEDIFEINLENIKKLEDLKKLPKKNVFGKDIQEAVSIFQDALTSLDEGASKKELQDMLEEMQEGANPEVIAVVEALSNMEFDKSIDEILNSDEAKINLIEQLNEQLEQIQEIELEPQKKENEQQITDFEFESIFEFSEIEIGEVPQQENQEVELDNKDTEIEAVEFDAGYSTAFFNIKDIIEKTMKTQIGNIKSQEKTAKDIVKEGVIVSRDEQEDVTVGI